MRIDLKQLQLELRSMTPQQAIYKVVRDELRARGNWCNKPRGNPSMGYKVMLDNKKKKAQG